MSLLSPPGRCYPCWILDLGWAQSWPRSTPRMLARGSLLQDQNDSEVGWRVEAVSLPPVPLLHYYGGHVMRELDGVRTLMDSISAKGMSSFASQKSLSFVKTSHIRSLGTCTMSPSSDLKSISDHLQKSQVLGQNDLPLHNSRHTS